MKGKIVKLFLLFQFTYTFSYAGCACKVGAFVYHNGLSVQHHFSYGTSGEYLFVYPGDSITLYGYSDGGTCPFNLLKIFFNNNLIYDGIGRSLTVYEIGAYHLELMCEADISYTFIATNNPLDTVEENSLPSSDSAQTSFESFFGISPSVSAGIFSFHNKGHQVNHIVISDAIGKIVFTSDEEVTEIDLSKNSDGIYFYRIEDSYGESVTGRIIKTLNLRQ